ncbi:hypothetical protein EG329_007374 [Mollisiaceae sp. DMI_Dod_QoI]|nr:hypothetical protein EG329_007374 [Helotiales sp. DMI_Dod_QoI]
MEAIGAIASIIGVAGAGAKLSIMLFEFASTVGSAGQEVTQIAIEISLFCSVLKQLRSTLTKARAYRYSLSALETTQEILGQCQEVFKEIERIVDGLQKRGGERSGEPTLAARVRWTFKRSQVQLLRTTLESCKVTLHIMLSTLDFAQKFATRRVSTSETQAEDEHEEMMTRSLIIAHQCTIDTLHRFEADEMEQLGTESGMPSALSVPEVSSAEGIVKSPTAQKQSQSFSNQSTQKLSPTGDSERKRASIWINDLLFDENPLPQGFRRQTWGDKDCAFFIQQQPYYFLRKWTDQGARLNEMWRKPVPLSLGKDPPTGLVNGENANTNPPTLQKSADSPTTPKMTLNESLLQSPNSGSGTKSSPDMSTQASASAPAVEIFKNYKVTMDDPCYKVLPAALKKYRIDAPWEQYHLYIVYEDTERLLGMDEKPLRIFKGLLNEGKKPVFMLRKRSKE